MLFRFSRLMPLLCVWSLVGLLGACASAPPVVEEEPVAATASGSDFLADVMAAPKVIRQSELEALLGEPLRVETAPANASGTTTKTVYYGLEVGLHEQESMSSVTWVAFTDARHTSPEGLRVGLAENSLLQMLGRPARQTSTQLFYEWTEPRPTTLVITMEQQAAVRLEWQFE